MEKSFFQKNTLRMCYFYRLISNMGLYGSFWYADLREFVSQASYRPQHSLGPIEERSKAKSPADVLGAGKHHQILLLLRLIGRSSQVSMKSNRQ